MDRAVAQHLLTDLLAPFRAKPYADIRSMCGAEPITGSIKHDGVTYQDEIQAFPDDRRRRNIRVMAAIDDGGWRAFFPMSSDFIMAPDGTFVDECTSCGAALGGPKARACPQCGQAVPPSA